MRKQVDPVEGGTGELLRELRVLIVAGISTGVVVVGLGSRLAMLVLRLTSPPSVRGVISDDGFEIGRFTLGGTYNLLVLGAAVGLLGASAYRAVAPWLLGPLWFRRLTVAAASGVVVGSMLVRSDGVDFLILKPLWLAVGLFVALPALFGIAIALAVDRVAEAPEPGSPRYWLVPLVLIAAFPLVIPLLAIAAIVLATWLPVRRAVRFAGGVPFPVGVGIRGLWLAIAVLGLLALIGDVRSLA